MSKQRVLLWGGTGFMGRSLIAALPPDLFDLTILTRSKTSMSDFAGNLHFFEYGFERSPKARSVLLEAVREADVVYNLAGTSGAVASNRDPVDHLEANCAWQLEFLEACRIAGNRPHVVFASSRLVYGKPEYLPVNEDHRLAPQSVYAAHKLAIEGYHQIWSAQGAISFTICRISVCYGQDGWTGKRDHGFLNTLIQDAVHGKPLTVFGSGEQVRDYIHVRDLARALVLCGNSTAARNEIVNVGSGQGISIAEVVQQVARATGAPVTHVAWPDSHLLVETGDYVSDISKLKRLTGFTPMLPIFVGIMEGMAATAA